MTQETKKFADFDLRPELLRALERKGFETPMPVQVCVLEDETLIGALSKVLAHERDELIVTFLYIGIGDLPIIREYDEAGILGPYEVPEHAVLREQVARAFAEELSVHKSL